MLGITLFFSMIIFIGISLFASALSILFYRGSYVSSFHNSISILFGGVLYPISFINENFLILEYFIPLHSILDVFRYYLGLLDLSSVELNLNICILIAHSFVFYFLGYITLKIAFNRAFTKGKISLY